MAMHVVRTKNYRKTLFPITILSIASVVIFHGPLGHAQSPPTTPPPIASTASQVTTASLAFEVATIKPVKDPNPGRMHDRTDGRQYSTRYTTLRDLIMMAYGLDPRQIIGGPAWIATDEYDIDAVAGDGALAAGNWNVMLQKLLVGRFQLTFHHEQREMNVYALVVAKGGPKLKAADAAEGHSSGCNQLGVCSFRGEPTDAFARWLQLVMDKPVVDKTGIAGEYGFTLTWTPDQSQFTSMGIHVPPPTDNPNAPPELFTAIQEQLGLKLESQKIQAEVLVIDHVERPSEN